MTVRARRPSSELDDRRRSQMTVARAGRPSSELDGRRRSQTTVIATRPSPEPHDNRSNDQPANTINDSIDRIKVT
jgi:hypothetical protein